MHRLWPSGTGSACVSAGSAIVCTRPCTIVHRTVVHSAVVPNAVIPGAVIIIVISSSVARVHAVGIAVAALVVPLVFTGTGACTVVVARALLGCAGVRPVCLCLRCNISCQQ